MQRRTLTIAQATPGGNSGGVRTAENPVVTTPQPDRHLPLPRHLRRRHDQDRCYEDWRGVYDQDLRRGRGAA